MTFSMQLVYVKQLSRFCWNLAGLLESGRLVVLASFTNIFIEQEGPLGYESQSVQLAACIFKTKIRCLQVHSVCIHFQHFRSGQFLHSSFVTFVVVRFVQSL